MRKLLNTLFVTSEDAYLTLDGENVVVNREKQEVARFPLHTLSGIIAFSYAGASPALMGGCAKRGVSLTFCTPIGRFLARSVGEENGNVLLRRMQRTVYEQHILYGVLLILLGIASNALSALVGGSHVKEFFSGVLMGMSVAEMLAGVVIVAIHVIHGKCEE